MDVNQIDVKLEAALVSALIAGVVSLVGSALTLWGVHWQVKSKISELQQMHLKAVLDARMKAYACLWRILQAQVSNWRMEGKRADGQWATRLYADLNACHAEHGVFYSQVVYEAFCEVRDAVGKMAASHRPDDEVPADKLRELDAIWSGKGRPGLAMQLKDDLGSYRPTIIRA